MWDCPDDFSPLPSPLGGARCYKVEQTLLTKLGADLACKTSYPGSRLLAMETVPEFIKVTHWLWPPGLLVSGAYNIRYWTSLTSNSNGLYWEYWDIVGAGYWDYSPSWHTDDETTTPGDCAVIEEGQLRAVQCSSTYYYICEHTVTPTDKNQTIESTPFITPTIPNTEGTPPLLFPDIPTTTTRQDQLYFTTVTPASYQTKSASQNCKDSNCTSSINAVHLSIGCSVAGLAALALFIFLVVFCIYKKRKVNKASNGGNETSTSAHEGNFMSMDSTVDTNTDKNLNLSPETAYYNTQLMQNGKIPPHHNNHNAFNTPTNTTARMVDGNPSTYYNIQALNDSRQDQNHIYENTVASSAETPMEDTVQYTEVSLDANTSCGLNGHPAREVTKYAVIDHKKTKDLDEPNTDYEEIPEPIYYG